MKLKVIDKYEFISIEEKDAEIIFSTAENNLDFNKNEMIGIKNINNIKKWFGVEEVGYLNQTHSDHVVIYDGKVYEGDALITDKKRTVIGVFTADCVPVIIYDEAKKVIAAVHSGWIGTEKDIVYKTLSKMEQEYNCNARDLKVYIGPHNMVCCYEFGEESLHKFRSNAIYKDLDIYENGKLNLQKCIIGQLRKKGIDELNVKELNICTYCNKDYKLHSYRKEKNKYGRMFSFVYLK